MAILGKLLLVFNLLAAGGLIYLATQDWARRQEINAAVVRHKLALAGLPTDRPAGDPGADDEIPFRFETSGGYVTETVSPALLKKYFDKADGGDQLGGADKPVASLVEEVQRVKEKAAARLTPMDDAAKLVKLCGVKVPNPDGTPGFKPGWLFLMAEGYEEREFVRLLATPADVAVARENAKTAGDLFDKKFATVLAAPDPKLAAAYAERLKAATEKYRAAGEKWLAAAKTWRDKADALQKAREDKAETDELKKEEDAALQAEAAAHGELAAGQKEFAAVLTDRAPTAARDEGDRRRRVAHLLAHLDPLDGSSPAWQTRVALVVGLRGYQAAVADQAPRLRDMAQATERGIEIDQAGFVAAYESLKQDALRRERLLATQIRTRKILEAQNTQQDDAVAQRQTFLTGRRARLVEIRKEVTGMLAAQAEVEARLFAVQQRVGETLAKNFDLEDQLDAAEARKAGRAVGAR